MTEGKAAEDCPHWKRLAGISAELLDCASNLALSHECAMSEAKAVPMSRDRTSKRWRALAELWPVRALCHWCGRARIVAVAHFSLARLRYRPQIRE